MSFWSKMFKSEEQIAADIEQALQGTDVKRGNFRGYDDSGRVILSDLSDKDILGGTVDYSRDTLNVAPLPRSSTLNIRTRKQCIMTIEIELRKGQHQRLAEDLQRLYDYMVGWQCEHNVPIIRSRAQKDLCVSSGTLRIWLRLLEKHGYIIFFEGYLIVKGLVYRKENE